MRRKHWRHTLSSWANKFLWRRYSNEWERFTPEISYKNISSPITVLSTPPVALPVQQAFLNWDVSVISAFLSTHHFLSPSLGNKHLFPFNSTSSTLHVWGGLTGTSLIKCKTLVLKVCCSPFSPREAGAPNSLLTFSSYIRWVIKHCSSCKHLWLSWSGVSCPLPWTVFRQPGLTSVNLQPLLPWPQILRCQVGFRWKFPKVSYSGWKEQRERL